MPSYMIDETPPKGASPIGGRKDDQGKTPWHLLPFDAVADIIAVLAFGEGKYGARNWEEGMDWSRPFDALLRHLSAWWQGEDRDPETGLSHLAHAGCCILFLLAYERRGIGRDDRPAVKKPILSAGSCESGVCDSNPTA